MLYILLTLSTLFWFGNFVISRGMHADIPPVGLAFWRWTVALLIISPIGLRLVWKHSPDAGLQIYSGHNLSWRNPFGIPSSRYCPCFHRDFAGHLYR